ncbi:MAG: cysteine desulfurase [Planctomycetaceae bacterium]|nr:cysteine desulfurase [Planctomycetaceae bacterium]
MTLRESNEVANQVIYLDCHSTTPVDPEVMRVMLPCFGESFGNAGSHSHAYGLAAAELVAEARREFGAELGVSADEIVFTSGSTESNNLAIFGAAKRWAGKRKQIVTIGIEHPSVLEPIRQLEREGWRVTVVPVFAQGDHDPGRAAEVGVVDLAALNSVLSEDTALVSIAMANHEVGVIQPIREIAELVHKAGAWLHTDATQAVGWMPLDLQEWQADLVSFSAHKFYGPKGVGALFVRRETTYSGARPIRLFPRTFGGGQEFGWRSGTVNTPGVVGMAAALRLANRRRLEKANEVAELRETLWSSLRESIPEILLNGPDWQIGGPRLPNNLNVAVPGIEGQSVMLHAKGVALSSGSACSSATPGVSSVLTALGIGEDRARSSLRIGLGRFHTKAEIQLAAARLSEAVRRLRG